MSQEKKYQVFISSTYTDLIDARNAAINTVLESYNFPVGMEMFGADNDEQWTIIKDLIDSSDFYILIMGHRYGSISRKDGISFTEKEFDYALEKGVKLMCFVRKDNVATLPHERDEDPAIKEKISQFRTKVTTDRTCEFWDSVDDLKHKISNSLYKNMRKHGGTGWVRGDQVSSQLAEEMAKLSEENRKLREENESLKESISIKKPLIKFSINDITNMPLNEENEIEIFWYKLREDYGYEKPSIINKQITRGNLKGQNLLSIGVPSLERFIDEYNEEIKSITDESIEQHNSALRALLQIESKSLNLEIFIENQGETLANKLDIEVTFPDFITIIDNASNDNVKSMKKSLTKLLIPEIKKPETRKDEYFSNLLGSHQLEDYNHFLSHRNVISNNVYTSNNIIYFREDFVLHSKKIRFNDFVLVPNSVGEGLVHVNIMCAEYNEPVTFSFPIRVT